MRGGRPERMTFVVQTERHPAAPTDPFILQCKIMANILVIEGMTSSGNLRWTTGSSKQEHMSEQNRAYITMNVKMQHECENKYLNVKNITWMWI